jgi:hypothetical protein
MAITDSDQSQQAAVDAAANSDIAASYQTVLTTVLSWPNSKQWALLRELFALIAREDEIAGKQYGTLSKVLGIASTDQPPPTDEEVEQWLDEHRMEKYG